MGDNIKSTHMDLHIEMKQRERICESSSEKCETEGEIRCARNAKIDKNFELVKLKGSPNHPFGGTERE